MSELSPPQQERSRQTLSAIADATKRLLQTHTFAELTIEQITTTAGASTGSFYARFKGKRALLHHLHEAFVDQSRANIKTFVALVGPQTMEPEQFVELWIPEVVKSHLDNHGLLRATMIESLDDPEFAVRATKLVRYISTRLAEVIRNHSGRQEAHIRNIEESMRLLASPGPALLETL